MKNFEIKDYNNWLAENNETETYINESIEVDIDKFYASHNSKPRGKGLWFLEVHGTDINDELMKKEIQWYGSYGNIKKDVPKIAMSEHGFEDVYRIVVMP